MGHTEIAKFLVDAGAQKALPATGQKKVHSLAAGIKSGLHPVVHSVFVQNEKFSADAITGPSESQRHCSKLACWPCKFASRHSNQLRLLNASPDWVGRLLYFSCAQNKHGKKAKQF